MGVVVFKPKIMKPEELRIGNYCIAGGSSHPKGKEVTVYSISETGINAWQDMAASGCDKFEDIEPIPLAEECLKAFGATEKKVPGCVSEWQIFISNFELNWDSETGLIIFSDNSNESISLDHIKYVHQLQNLYFALAEKELTKQ